MRDRFRRRGRSGVGQGQNGGERGGEKPRTSIREISDRVGQSSAIVGRAVTASQETGSTIEVLTREVERIGTVAA